MDLKSSKLPQYPTVSCHHLRGGVDLKNQSDIAGYADDVSPPSWWCGFKDKQQCILHLLLKSPPSWWCGFKVINKRKHMKYSVSPPSWWCGFKDLGCYDDSKKAKSPPSWWCGFKGYCDICTHDCGCHHLRGGVDLKIQSLRPFSFQVVTTFVVVWI